MILNLFCAIDELIKTFSKRFDSDTMNVFRLSSHYLSDPNSFFNVEDLKILANQFSISLSALQKELV